jgi:hypothetical protein
MQNNVESYDAAVAETANELLLLNAVRASQHYPMSFTLVGNVQGGPQLQGSLSGMLNFSNAVGLTTSNVSPNASTIAPGYSLFALSNLNDGESMERLRKPISRDIIDSFIKAGWPTELIHLLYTLEFKPTEPQLRDIETNRHKTCARPPTERDMKFCTALDRSIRSYAARCPDIFGDSVLRERKFKEDKNMYYNSAATYCHYARFQIFLTELWLLRTYELEPCAEQAQGTRTTRTTRIIETSATTKTGGGARTEERTIKDTQTRSAPTAPGGSPNQKKICLPGTVRTALQMIEYLGQLIAAQNYIDSPFVPTVLIGISSEDGGFDLAEVPLFVVKRGIDFPPRAAVMTRHKGEHYYIPQPEFGSPNEARSLQALDLVLQTARAATQKSDIPKTSPAIAVTQ